ncbi:MAG: lysophospholipid acyltransferase family protein [Cellulosilyticaceae bacterium]
MLKTIYWYFYFALSAVMLYPQLLKVKKYIKNGQEELAEELIYSVTSSWAMKQIKNAGATINVHGIDNIPKKAPVVFISNHQSNFDIAIFMACIPTPKGYISKIEMKKIPLIRTWMEYMHCIFMDRSTAKSSYAAIIDGIKTINNGHSLVIFPEGTRSRCDKMAEFKGGSFKLATRSKAPIVPVTINGSYKLMEGNNGNVKAGTVDIYIHPPVYTSELSKEECNELPTQIQSIIQSKLPN